MITRERLEKLIKQEATIWVKNQYCNAYDVELSNYDYVAITDNKESLMFLDYSIQEDNPESVLVDYLENLYETKEDAEWASIAIYRTEIFDPPACEEIQYTKNYFIYKFSIKDNYDFFGRIAILKDYNIKVSGLVQGVLFEEYFNEAASKENYIKACTIARKLFLGESVDEI